MKLIKFSRHVVFALSVATMGLAAACNNGTNTTGDAATAKDSTSNTAEVYECPMQCEGSTSNKPGKCPVCEMDLVKKS